MSFITPLFSSVIGHETSPEVRREILPLVENRREIVDRAEYNLRIAESVQSSEPTGQYEHFVNNHPMPEQIANITRDSNTLGEIVGIQSTNTPAATAAVKELNNSNGDLDLQQAISPAIHKKYIEEITNRSEEHAQTSSTVATLTQSGSPVFSEADQAVLEARTRVAELQRKELVNPAQHIIDATQRFTDDQFNLAA